MTIQDMEYDVKFKLNKVDSNAFRGLNIPELDWAINQAHEAYISNAVASKRPNGLAFEINERITTDIAPLVIKKTITPVNGVVTLPTDYRNYVRASATVKKGNCTLPNKVWIVQHEDLTEYDQFSKPSFLWQEVNGFFEKEGLVLDADGTIEEVELTYVKKHPYVHNADGYSPSGYQLPSGVLLTGTQNSELPESVHREIVDLAVAFLKIEMASPDSGLAQQKFNLKQ